jgi:hypothetical protein
MKKALVPAVLLVLVSIVLGATILRVPMANAAGSVASIFIANDKQHPLPVEEQNLDADGNIRVHEQGIADVNVTNTGLAVAPAEPITGGGGGLLVGPCPLVAETAGRVTATVTALQISWGHTSGVKDLILRHGSSVVAAFVGPAISGDPSAVTLPLSRPIAFNTIECTGNGVVEVHWVGSQP